MIKMNKIKTITSLLLVIILVNSCVKKDPVTKIAQVLFVPLSPNAPVIDFTINTNTYATSVGYSSTVGTTTYTLPYYTIEPISNATIAYSKNGLSSNWANVSANLEDDKVYSTFFIDSFAKAKAVIVKDDLSDPSEGKVKIRFFHFSPNAPAVDVRIAGTTTNLYSNRTFNDQNTTSSLQNFIEVNAGLFSFEILLAGTNTVVYTISSLTLKPDRIYTLAARGFVGGAGNIALGGWVYPNKP
jgi:Domain of unknown function (DUF4397)